LGTLALASCAGIYYANLAVRTEGIARRDVAVALALEAIGVPCNLIPPTRVAAQVYVRDGFKRNFARSGPNETKHPGQSEARIDKLS
jgi:hypothetical protein